jgi:uncharacterized protein
VISADPPVVPVMVLDSYALLGYFFGEPGSPRVKEVLESALGGSAKACLSIMSLGEVAYIVERRYGLPGAHAALAAVEELPVEVVEAGRDAVLGAAHVKARYRISYADAFVVALARSRAGTILTGDPEFRAVEAIANIEWL